MEIHFSIGQLPAKLTRGWFWGGMKLVAPGHGIWLQHPLQWKTHFDLRLTRSWERSVDGHQVRVEKLRPLMLAGLRAQDFRIYVDGNLAAHTNGR
jgi:hypothetical protein